MSMENDLPDRRLNQVAPGKLLKLQPYYHKEKKTGKYLGPNMGRAVKNLSALWSSPLFLFLKYFLQPSILRENLFSP